MLRVSNAEILRVQGLHYSWNFFIFLQLCSIDITDQRPFARNASCHSCHDQDQDRQPELQNKLDAIRNQPNIALPVSINKSVIHQINP